MRETMMERKLRAAKYCAEVTMRRAEKSRKMDRMVIRCLVSAAVVFAWALLLALLVGTR